jgi:hypothetical protein
LRSGGTQQKNEEETAPPPASRGTQQQRCGSDENSNFDRCGIETRRQKNSYDES